MTLQRGPIARMQKGDFNPDLHPRQDDGRFTESTRAEPSAIDLDGSEGTFAFPPRPTSAEQLVNFWSNVSISDDVLSSTQAASSDRKARAWSEAVEGYVRENPQPSEVSDAARDGYNEALRIMASESVAETCGPDLGPYETRPVVRATKLWAEAHALPEGERQRVHATVVTTPQLGATTVENVVATYRSHELLGSMVDRPR